MKVRAIDFVEVRVSDMDRTLRFYQETLSMYFPLFGKTAQWKELQSPPLAVAFGYGPEPPGAVVLALAADSLSEAVEELRSKAVAILSEVREQDVCSCDRQSLYVVLSFVILGQFIVRPWQRSS